jgi:excisionase family DNA binding protein
VNCARILGRTLYADPGVIFMETQTNWLTAPEAASYLKVKPGTLLMWARSGKVKGYVLSGTHRITWRFRQVDLDAMLCLQSVTSTNGGLK